MKKLAIAGASLALAALPMVGVFAADPDPITDTVKVTVSPTCTFTRTGTGTYTATLGVNDLSSSVGSSVFTAICNNATGFSVGASVNALTGPGESITYSATTPTAGSGTWTATKSGGQNIAATDGVLMSTNTVTPAAGEQETVTYKASTKANQAAGSYQGTIVYTLTQNS